MAGDSLHDLTESELQGLVAALVVAELGGRAELSTRGAEVRLGTFTARRIDVEIRRADGGLEIVEILPADAQPERIARLALDGRREGRVRRLHVAAITELEADAIAALEAAAGDVELVVWDAAAIERALGRHSDIKRRFFQLEPESERGALERFLIDLAPEVPEAYPASGPVRLALLVAIVAGLVWLPIPQLDKHQAGWVGGTGLGLLLLVYCSALVSRRAFGDLLARVAGWAGITLTVEVPARVDLEWRLQRLPSGWLVLLATALAFLVFRGLRWLGGFAYGVGFFLTWALVYLLVWGLDPAGCAAGASTCAGPFLGVDAIARIGDFMLLAVGTAFLSPPETVQASSALAQALVTAELVTAGALLVSFATRLGIDARARSAGGAPS